MTTAIDRAAKAISEATLVTADGKTCPQNAARAALATTSEPTQEMIEAGEDFVERMFDEPGGAVTRLIVTELWRTMHDAMMGKDANDRR
jgi:hypothetical protein